MNEALSFTESGADNCVSSLRAEVAVALRTVVRCCAAFLALVATAFWATPAGAVVATATIEPGPLTLALGFPEIQTLAPESVTARQIVQVTDASASGAGWGITVAVPQSARPSAPLEVAAAAACSDVSSCTSYDGISSGDAPRGAVVKLLRSEPDERGQEAVALTFRFASTSSSRINQRIGQLVVVSLVTGP